MTGSLHLLLQRALADFSTTAYRRQAACHRVRTQRYRLGQQCCSGSRSSSSWQPQQQQPEHHNSTSAASAGSGPASLLLYNSLTETTEPVLTYSTATAAAKGIACYTCGPTVYAPSHLGHARTYVWLDIMRRVLEHQASSLSCTTATPPPLFVLNITDIDDKILRAAVDNAEPPLALARRYEEEFWKGWDALNCLRPHVVTRVTEHVDSDIVPYIQKIADNGMTYDIEGKGLYFSVRAYEEKMQKITKYGKLAPPNAATDFFSLERPAAESVSNNETADATSSNENDDYPPSTNAVSEKRDPRDFVLWKFQKPDETLSWNSPWGKGRPGWHIECSAMIEAVQKQFQKTHTFSMHAGGIDLKFPHHTNEIAQAEAFHFTNGIAAPEPHQEWIRHWVHTGHLHIDGRKMSKSLKNFVTIHELLTEEAQDEAAAAVSSAVDDFRLWCLGISGPYRGKAIYSRERIDLSRTIRQKIVRFLVTGEDYLRARKAKSSDFENPDVKKWSSQDFEFYSSINASIAICRGALLNDLDGAKFISTILEVVGEGMNFIDTKVGNNQDGPIEPMVTVLNAVREMLSLVGFTDKTCRAGLSAETGQVSSERERAILDALTAFRSQVRRKAIGEGPESSEEKLNGVLKACGDVRDKTFPSLGVEFMDGKVIKVDDTDGQKTKPAKDSWRYCVPRSPSLPDPIKTSQPEVENKTIRNAALRDRVPFEMVFQVGQWEGKFSEFDEHGFPLRKADGSPLSDLLKRRLRKKFQHYARTYLKVETYSGDKVGKKRRKKKLKELEKSRRIEKLERYRNDTDDWSKPDD
jgi:cysteinyl-tRNA synthetase